MSIIKQALESMNHQADSKNSSYYNIDGNKVPRVTEILSKMIHSDGLMYWANHLGLRGLKYKDELNRAANAGTVAHNAIEMYLKEKIQDNSNIPFMGFLSWYNTLTEDLGLDVNVLKIEEKLTCEWFGGTLDALMSINGRVFIVDFKTSNHVTYKYFLQLSAYIYMLKLVGINVDGAIVLQLNKSEIGFNEYLLDFSIPSHLEFISNCEIAFLSLVYAFYNIDIIEHAYSAIF